jgi:hypothetical protein
LDDNFFTSVPSATFAAVTYLTKLSLNGNPLSDNGGVQGRDSPILLNT